MRVSVIIPSMGRPDQLRRCVERLIETTRAHDVEIICVIECPDSLRAVADLPIIIIANPEHKRAAACWNQGTLLATGDAFVLGSDDMVWGDGWLDATLSALDKLGGSGMVGFNDGHTDGSTAFAAQYLMTRDYIVQHQGGWFVPPYYKHFYFDLESTKRARRAGLYLWAEDADVEHKHPAFKTAPTDTTYKCAAPFMATDRAIYQARQAAGFPDDLEPILKE